MINPFELKNKSETAINYMVQELSSAFMEIVKSDTTDQMDALLEACIETLLRKEELPDVSELKRFMDDNENDDLVEL